MTLPLDSLLIQGFRLFRDFRVPRLGRVNLLIGKNNSGKSTVLEALRLFASRGSAHILWDVLENRDELSSVADRRPSDTVDVERLLLSFASLFSGRSDAWATSPPIRIGSLHGDILELSAGWLYESDSQTELFGTDAAAGKRPALMVRTNDEIRHLPLDIDSRAWRMHRLRDADRRREHAYVPPNGLAIRDAARLWDNITLTELEDDILRALRIVTPEIERLSFISENFSRVPVAKVRDYPRPVPLRALGDGVMRILGITMSLVSARGGFALIDEAENGIHFSAQPKLWQLIFNTAHRLNVQVFATTHSWDCIEAFQRAASADSFEEAALIRLTANAGTATPKIFSEHELSIVTRDQIEVR